MLKAILGQIREIKALFETYPPMMARDWLDISKTFREGM